jgi:hypothetical protein
MTESLDDRINSRVNRYVPLFSERAQSRWSAAEASNTFTAHSELYNLGTIHAPVVDALLAVSRKRDDLRTRSEALERPCGGAGAERLVRTARTAQMITSPKREQSL